MGSNGNKSAFERLSGYLENLLDLAFALSQVQIDGQFTHVWVAPFTNVDGVWLNCVFYFPTQELDLEGRPIYEVITIGRSMEGKIIWVHGSNLVADAVMHAYSETVEMIDDILLSVTKELGNSTQEIEERIQRRQERKSIPA
jgi:hypothetical protein